MFSSRLLALPAELRNTIYELYVATEHTNPVDLCNTNPPSKTFLLTYRQIYDEVKGIHESAYQSYWTETHFTLSRDITTQDNDSADNILATLPAEDLEHIQNLTITLDYRRSKFTGVKITMNPLPHSNTWKVIFSATGRESRMSYFVFDRNEKGRRCLRHIEGDGKDLGEGVGERLAVKEQICFMAQKLNAVAPHFRRRL